MPDIAHAFIILFITAAGEIGIVAPFVDGSSESCFLQELSNHRTLWYLPRLDNAADAIEIAFLPLRCVFLIRATSRRLRENMKPRTYRFIFSTSYLLSFWLFRWPRQCRINRSDPIQAACAGPVRLRPYRS
jgi:hypothetical protein